MKYIIILCDGMSDLPCDDLGGKTPMSVANKPNMDTLAKVSEVGLVRTVPDSLPPGSDVANLSVLGYDPEKYYTGRSPFEAASMGIEMNPDDVAIRCNLVTLSDEKDFRDATMVSYCADDIHTEQAAEIIAEIDRELGSDSMKFYPGISYRHCLIWKNGKTDLNLVPPHDIIGKKIADYIQPDENSREILKLMEKSYALLRGKQANCIWLWGEGKKAALPAFRDEFGLNATMISAVDLLKGIGKIAEMETLEVEGVTGYIDTNFSGKAKAAVDSLKSGQDLVYIHVEAPDECGHRGETANKIKSIELIDELILGTILKEFKGEPLKILITPDHPTPLSLMTHTREPVPFLIYDSSETKSGVACFDEKSAESTGYLIEKGHELMRKFIWKNKK
ncbi:MAG: cofactor-independent phosphoglycerate mutase [Oscillospiraceae bacterium]|nr:cofactor-independent phosphoglycerate mutase [Oscillospiraceae bacterium]